MATERINGIKLDDSVQPNKSVSKSPDVSQVYDKLQLNPIEHDIKLTPSRDHKDSNYSMATGIGTNNLGFQVEKRAASTESVLLTPYAIDKPIRYHNAPMAETQFVENDTGRQKTDGATNPRSSTYSSISDVAPYTLSNGASAQYEELPIDSTRYREHQSTRKRNLLYECDRSKIAKIKTSGNDNKKIRKDRVFCNCMVLFIVSVVAIIGLIIALLLTSGAISVSCSTCGRDPTSDGSAAELKQQLYYLKQNLSILTGVSALNSSISIASLQKDLSWQKALIQELRRELMEQKEVSKSLNMSVNNIKGAKRSSNGISKCNFTSEGTYGVHSKLKQWASNYKDKYIAYATCGFKNARNVTLNKLQLANGKTSYFCECGGNNEEKGCFIYYWQCWDPP